LPAALRLRVRTAFFAVARRFRVLAAFAAAARRFRVSAAFCPGIIWSISFSRFREVSCSYQTASVRDGIRRRSATKGVALLGRTKRGARAREKEFSLRGFLENFESLVEALRVMSADGGAQGVMVGG
jgi:hypothetical protein